MATVDVLDLAGKKVGSEELAADVFEAEVKPSLMHQVVVAGAAAQRSGTHSTKTRAEVRGGGRKPWRQKGTGRARAGSIRAPQWAGGGVAHGPHPRDHAQRLPKKMRRAALRSALSSRASDGKLIVVEGFELEEPKTKRAVEILGAVGAGEGKVLVVLAGPDATTEKAFRNLQNVRITYGRSLSTFEVLAADTIVFARQALPLVGRGSDAGDEAGSGRDETGSGPDEGGDAE
jgi:large subunit ribosomal protein L4